jgi:hypothetical protein
VTTSPDGGHDVCPCATTISARRPAIQRAIVVTSNSLLTVVYHLLSDPDARFARARILRTPDKYRRARDLATELQALTGQHSVIRDGKAVITAADSHRRQPPRSIIRLGKDSVVRAIMTNNSRRACTAPFVLAHPLFRIASAAMPIVPCLNACARRQGDLP